MRRGGAFLLISLLAFSSLQCTRNEAKDIAKHDLCRLEQTAMRIDQDFRHIRKLVELYAGFVREVFAMQKGLRKGLTHSRYRLHENTIYYKPKDDGGSALFVSGAVPVNDRIRARARFTEFFDLFMKPAAAAYPEISQIYFNDPESLCRIYPYFDVLMVFEPKLDVRQFNFFYLADPQHNPDRKSLWINEPYVDPAGRGWTVSAITPVYLKDQFLGVAGIDVTIKNIVDRYLNTREQIFVLVDNNGLVVATEESGARILALPPLVDHKYIATIRSDTFRSEQFNLLKSPNRSIRNLAQAVVHGGRRRNLLMLDGRSYTVLAAKVGELGWTLWQIQEN